MQMARTCSKLQQRGRHALLHSLTGVAWAGPPAFIIVIVIAIVIVLLRLIVLHLY